MRIACPNCGNESVLKKLKYDEVNLERFCMTCEECGTSFNIDFVPERDTFITDVAKMADFKILTKEEFLDSYSYLSEYEYDETKLYLEWLKTE